MRSNSNRKHNQIQHFDHLKIRVQSTRNKDSSHEEQKSFSQIDKATRNTISTTFNKSAFDTSSQSFIDRRIELSLENASHLTTSLVYKAITPAKTGAIANPVRSGQKLQQLYQTRCFYGNVLRGSQYRMVAMFWVSCYLEC